jgi:hypothetical protein
MTEVNVEVPVVFVTPPYAIDVSKAAGDATLDNFGVTNDGTAYFLLDGQKYLAGTVALLFLRRFAIRNDIRNSQPLRRGTQQLIVDEIMYKLARLQIGLEDPSRATIAKDSKKPSSENLFRLANVVFSEGL